MRITGGCHCGNIKFEAVADTQKVVICHCSDCQIMGGSAFRTVAMVDGDSFNLSGEVSKYIKTGSSGNPRVQAFCPKCGSHIYASANEENPSQYNIRLGTVDQRNELPPKIEMWCDSAQDWLEPISGTKRFPQQPG